MWRVDSGSAIFICSSMMDGNMMGNAPLQKKFIEAVDAPPVGAHLVPRVGGRGTTVKVVDRPGPVEADALIIRRSLQFRLTMLPGDCPPIVLVINNLPALALVHGSRDALGRGVIQKTLQRLERMGADSKWTHAWVGPGIRSCCYQLTKDRLRRWPMRHACQVATYAQDGCYAVNLQGFIREQLSMYVEDRITIAPECTSCAFNSDGYLFPSHRRSILMNGNEERFIAIVWLK